ncbi:RagB/SusD family nutrient uptake outer membrane protein [Pedobacter sp. JCM 36344]|uniref:RagB/SusD family nutrient uptake outer membrane protein n=1 Tax=Pedobacter sp. JCM 36344 TaxID=3374280 RepID=UPI00397E269C
MKKILLAVGTLAVLISGCKKDLTQFPYNQVETTQAFNTETDLNLAVNGMYAGLRTSGSYFVGQWNIMADVLADNLVLNPIGRLSLKQPFYEWRYTGESTYGLFQGGYTITRRANAILENVGKLPETAVTKDARGQALAIRALTYFDMCRAFSKTYLNADATDFTLPYVTVTDPTILPGNESVQGFYDKVIADLVEAEGLINTSTASVAAGKINKNAVAGILSRVYLYKGDYANSIAAANRALTAVPSIGTLTTFPNIWTDATSESVLFKVRNTVIDGVNSQGVNYYQTVGGLRKSEYLVDYSFYQLFAANDIRKTTYIATSLYAGNNANHIIKYNGRPGLAAGVVDAKVIRTGEVLLNRMEANYRSGTISAAVADLVLLKSNRYTGYVSTLDLALTGTSLLNEILLQRRLELAFEGDRFWNLKRLNLPVNRDAVHGERADGTGTPPVFPILAVGDKRFQLPYPQVELNFNKNLKQNKDYDKP